MAKKATKIEQFENEAKAELEAFESVQKFETIEACVDKKGEKTKVLIVDTDKKGLVGLFFDIGHPYTVNPAAQKHENTVTEDKEKLKTYLKFMSNIDLDSEDNLEAIGLDAIEEARAVVAGFFMLRLASKYFKTSEPKSSSNTSKKA